MQKKFFSYKNFKYVLALPDDFSEDKQYPLLVLLHGAGGRGNDGISLGDNPYFTFTEPLHLPAVTFAPQCFANSWFDIFEQLQDFIAFAMNHPFVDSRRVYLIGASMGGYATWQMAMTHPEWFAAIVPICGGGMYWNAQRLKNMGVWAFHGSEDDTVKPEESEKMTEAVNRFGGNAKLTIYPGTGHNSWEQAYSDPETFRWLFGFTRQEFRDGTNPYDNAKQFG